MARSKKTLALSEIVGDVLKRADKKGRRFGAQAVNAWRDVVGEEVARHTRGFALRDNHELVVFVDNAAWAQQLSLMSVDLQRRLNAHLGEKSVRSLRFTVSRKVTDETLFEARALDVDTYYEPELNEPAPLSEVELSQAVQVAQAVKAPGLREQALRVMVKDLEQKKGARIHNAPQAPRDTPQ